MFARRVAAPAIVLAILLLHSFPIPAGAAEPVNPEPLSPELVKGITQVDEGDLEAAVATLDGVVQKLSATSGNDKELALGHLYLGIAHLGLSQWERAEHEMREAWRRDHGLRLDPKQFPPRVIRLLDEVKAAEPGPTEQRPTPTATRSHGSRNTLLIVGAIAAGGAAGAIAAGSHANPTSTPLPTPSPTPTAFQYQITGPGGCGSSFHVDNFIRVFIGGVQTGGDIGNTTTSAPVDFTSKPGLPGVIQFFDDGGGRVLDPLYLCKEGSVVAQLTPGVPASHSSETFDPPVLVLTVNFTLP
jgi:hypothetical protein